MNLFRKCYVKLWHKCSYEHAKQIEKGYNVIRYSRKGDGNTISEYLFQHGNESFNYVPLHASLPQILNKLNIKKNFIKVV